MKTLLLLILVSIIFSCKQTKQTRIDKAQLSGVWVVSNINLIDRLFKNFKSVNSSDKSINNQLLNFYYFDANNNFSVDTGSTTIIKGTYKINDSVIVLTSNDSYIKTISYTAMQVADTSKMRLYTDFVTQEDKLVYEFKKVHDVSALNNNWKIILSNNATESQIKEKLKNVLSYYASYFKALSDCKIGVFSANRVLLPLQLYNGGVGLKDKSKMTDDFIKLMGSEQNANVSYELLQKCFQAKFEYPEINNDLALEYSKVINHLANSVK